MRTETALLHHRQGRLCSFKRSAVWHLALLLVLGGLVPSVRAMPAEQYEIPQLRTLTTKTFQLPNGTQKMVLNTEPFHYRDGNGFWQDIDTTPRFASASEGPQLVIDRAPYHASFPTRLTPGKSWAFRVGEETVKVAPLRWIAGSRTEWDASRTTFRAEWSGDRIRYVPEDPSAPIALTVRLFPSQVEVGIEPFNADAWKRLVQASSTVGGSLDFQVEHEQEGVSFASAGALGLLNGFQSLRQKAALIALTGPGAYADPEDTSGTWSVPATTRLLDCTSPPVTIELWGSDGSAYAGYIQNLGSGQYSRYVNGSNPLVAGANDSFRAFCRWDTIAIPDNFVVSTVELDVYTQALTGGGLNIEVRSMNQNPENAVNLDTLWRTTKEPNFALFVGNFAADVGSSHMVTTLNSTANIQLQNRLILNWFALSLCAEDISTGARVDFGGYSGGHTTAPKLSVVYVPPTCTPTPSSTPTPTGTPSTTPTGTPSSTPTITLTPTITVTPTVTPSPSATPSGTPTGTPSATPSGTPTGTPTATYTPCVPPEIRPLPPCTKGSSRFVQWDDTSICAQLPPGQIQWEVEAYSDSGYSSRYDLSGPVNVPFYTFTNLQHGVEYYYTVKSLNTGSPSIPSHQYYGPVSSLQDQEAPVSAVGDLNAAYHTRTIYVPYTVMDSGCGPDYVELYVSIDFGPANYAGQWVSSPIPYVAALNGEYQFYTLACDVVGNCELTASVTKTTTVDAGTPIPTFSPTITPTPVFSYTPTPTRTPTPSATPSPTLPLTATPTITPTFTPSLTPDVTSTPTMTPSPTQGPAPVILLAGYWDTYLNNAAGGTLTLAALVSDPNGVADVARVEVEFEGAATGVILYDDGTHGDFIPSDGFFMLGGLVVGGGTPTGRYKLELRATDLTASESKVWPYLNVE